MERGYAAGRQYCTQIELRQIGAFDMENRDDYTDYIHIMLESLQKKQSILSRIVELNRQQKILLQDANVTPEEFEKNISYKGNMIEQLNLLDSGFEKLFERVRESLQGNKEAYAEEIAQMQALIKEITSLTNTIQTQELRNHDEAVRKFASVKKQVKGVRNSQKVVKQYYQTMMTHKKGMASAVDNKQ